MADLKNIELLQLIFSACDEFSLERGVFDFHCILIPRAWLHLIWNIYCIKRNSKLKISGKVTAVHGWFVERSTINFVTKRKQIKFFLLKFAFWLLHIYNVYTLQIPFLTAKYHNYYWILLEQSFCACKPKLLNFPNFVGFSNFVRDTTDFIVLYSTFDWLKAKMLDCIVLVLPCDWLTLSRWPCLHLVAL